MLTENQMTLSTRRIERIMPVLVTGTERGMISVVYLTPRGVLVREKLFCSGWETVVPMKTVVDVQPYISTENNVGFRILGLTPESVAEPIRTAILERMNE